ncbi:MAG: O-antigen ligase family protein [Actinobacteria bacterium]|nr:O-antigen ligase family protein [Actinomycetota bacterium]
MAPRLRRAHLKRELPGAALAAGAVLLLSFADGGFFPGSWRAATAVFLFSAALARVLRRQVVASRAQWLCLAGFVALTAWTALSSQWSPDPGAAWLEAQRTLVYVTAIAAAIAVAGSLVTGTLAGVGLVCAYSLGQRLLEGAPSPLEPFVGDLLQEPLGYANALGGLAAIGLAVAAGLLVRDPRRRILLAVLVALFIVTLALTQNRGGWIAAVIGVALAVALGLGRVRLARRVALTAGVLLAFALALPSGSLADDLAKLGEERAWYWHVAWQEAADSPLFGRGAGTFELSWLERQPVPWNVLDAHSLYLEMLAELGVIGVLLVALALAPPLVAALRDARAPAAAGGYVAFLVHAGLDWDWEMPAVTVAGILCGSAILLAHSRARVDDNGWPSGRGTPHPASRAVPIS